MQTVKERVDMISRNDNLSLNTPQTTAKIEISGFCSLNCKFCYHKIMKENIERQRFMTDKDFHTVMEHIETFYPNIKEIGLFYMGESGLHPKLAEFYKELKDRGYFTYLTTNGTVRTNVMKAIPYIDSLKVSWNYRNRADFCEKTGEGRIWYDQIRKNINILYLICKSLNKPLAISTVLDTEKEDYAESLKGLKYDEHYWIPLQTQGGTIEKGYDGVVGEDDNKVSPIPCWSLFKGLYIDADLNVRTCCYGHGKLNVLYKIGDEVVSSDKEKTSHLLGIIPEMCKQCLH